MLVTFISKRVCKGWLYSLGLMYASEFVLTSLLFVCENLQLWNSLSGKLMASSGKMRYVRLS